MLIIKNYDGHSLEKIILHTLHEEAMNLIGERDVCFEEADNLRKYFCDKYTSIPDAILFTYAFSKKIYDLIKRDLPNTKIMLFNDDLHWYSSYTYESNLFSFSNADIIISHHGEYYYKEMYHLEKNIIRMPHSCSSIFFRDDINWNSENKIYMYGAVTNNYHLRQEFLKNMEKYSDKLVLRPYYGSFGNKDDGISTSNELYKYSFGFATGYFPNFEFTIRDDTPYYIIAKFFEIPGSGALLLCNDYRIKDELNKFGFYNMVNYVNINDANFDDIINFLFDPLNKDKIIEIRKNGHQLIKSAHTLAVRMSDTNNEIIKYLNGFNFL